VEASRGYLQFFWWSYSIILAVPHQNYTTNFRSLNPEIFLKEDHNEVKGVNADNIKTDFRQLYPRGISVNSAYYDLRVTPV
tara:strand:- start:449 stop:691 length:243 start_codon:yes stop_codon:yes gene_type:complete